MWWKLIYRADTGSYVAWMFPNDRSADAASIDDHITDIPTLKARLEFVPDFAAAERGIAATASWPVASPTRYTLRCENRTTQRG